MKTKRAVPWVGPAVALALLFLIAPPVESIDLKPHPLYGESMLIDSSELVTFWPKGTGALCALQVMDFNSNPASLLPTGSEDLEGGVTNYRFQQLDVACGDFDGDGDGDVVAAYGRALESNYHQEVRLVIPQIDRDDLNWATSTQVAWGEMQIAPSECKSPSNIRLAGGNLIKPAADAEPDVNADRRDELVLATRLAGGGLRVEVLELNDEGAPVSVAWAVVDTLDDQLVRTARFDVVTSDFDDDGIDEIVIAGVRRIGTGTHIEVFVHIYALDLDQDPPLTRKGTLALRDVDQLHKYEPGGAWWRATNTIDHIVLATGDLTRGDVRDEIVLGMSFYHGEWVDDGWNDNDYNCYSSSHFYPLSVRDSWDITAWGDNVHSGTGAVTIWNDAGDHDVVDIGVTGPSLGLDVADLNGDGQDEIVASGAFGSGLATFLRIYEAEEDETISIGVSAIGGFMAWDDPSTNILKVMNLDAVSEVSATTHRPEIVLLDRAGTASTRTIYVYRPVLTENPPQITGLTSVCNLPQPGVPYVGSNNNKRCVTGDAGIYCADADGDAARLGSYTFNHLTDVVQPLVILNRPPVHYDVLDGVGHDPAGCFPGWGCDCFYSVYSESNEQQVSLEQEVHSDWGIGTGIKTDHEFLGIGLKTSLEASHGKNFSRTTAATQTITTSLSYAATDWPEYRATILNYDMWEYEVFSAGEMVGHLAVTRPQLEQASSTWLAYNAMPMQWLPFPYDPNNILSYPAQVPVDTTEVAESWFSDSFVISEGTSPNCLNGTRFDWTNEQSHIATQAWDFGVEAGAEVDFGGVTASVKGHYGRGEIATHSTAVTNGFTIENHFDKLDYNAAGDLDWPYRVLPFIYRSTTGALVLHYAVQPNYGQPGIADTIWETYYDEHPDPAFLLPFYHDIHRGDKALVDLHYLSPDIRLQPSVAAMGDTVRISAVLHNLSLAVQPDPVQVRFYVGDPDEVTPYPIHDTGGHDVWQVGGIAVRDTAMVAIEWVVPGAIPENPRIFAVLSPLGSAGELQTFNNKGFAILVAPGFNPTSVYEVGPSASYMLHQNRPNPFNPVTEISFTLGAPGQTQLCIFDVAGRRVATLVDEKLRAGTYAERWDGRTDDGRTVASGVYLYRLETPTYTEVKHMLLLK